MVMVRLLVRTWDGVWQDEVSGTGLGRSVVEPGWPACLTTNESRMKLVATTSTRCYYPGIG